jgi:hypothetical protein
LKSDAALHKHEYKTGSQLTCLQSKSYHSNSEITETITAILNDALPCSIRYRSSSQSQIYNVATPAIAPRTHSPRRQPNRTTELPPLLPPQPHRISRSRKTSVTTPTTTRSLPPSLTIVSKRNPSDDHVIAETVSSHYKTGPKSTITKKRKTEEEYRRLATQGGRSAGRAARGTGTRR